MTSLWLDTCLPTPTPAGLPGSIDTLVVGAGLTGLATAVLLARAGQDVTVVEARHVGAVATGNTTAKLSLLQGTVLSQMRRHHSADVVRAYVEANREGQAWLLRLLDERDVAYDTRIAWTYATTPRGRDVLADELGVAQEAGLPVLATTETELPFPARAIRLADQAQIHPTRVLETLLRELERNGGRVVEGVRLTGVETGEPCVAQTTVGEIRAQQVVLATGTPVLDRGVHFARLEAHRSYATAFEASLPVPQGMYLSTDDPARSLRTATTETGTMLLVGGNDHVVGRVRSERAQVDGLVEWAHEHFPGLHLTHSWSAQDYRPAGRVPVVGPMPRSQGRVHVATGYDKWGMTNAVAAALTLSADILRGVPSDWATTLRGGLPTPRDITSGVATNAAVGAGLVAGWAGELTARAKGERRDCPVSRVCTHLGGILEWNDAESSWDCPLHGSRFDADGRVLEGPATRDLDRNDQDRE